MNDTLVSGRYVLSRQDEESIEMENDGFIDDEFARMSEEERELSEDSEDEWDEDQKDLSDIEDSESDGERDSDGGSDSETVDESESDSETVDESGWIQAVYPMIPGARIRRV